MPNKFEGIINLGRTVELKQILMYGGKLLAANIERIANQT
jgi:hypothetical protein